MVWSFVWIAEKDINCSFKPNIITLKPDCTWILVLIARKIYFLPVGHERVVCHLKVTRQLDVWVSEGSFLRLGSRRRRSGCFISRHIHLHHVLCPHPNQHPLIIIIIIFISSLLLIRFMSLGHHPHHEDTSSARVVRKRNAPNHSRKKSRLCREGRPKKKVVEINLIRILIITISFDDWWRWC